MVGTLPPKKILELRVSNRPKVYERWLKNPIFDTELLEFSILLTFSEPKGGFLQSKYHYF